MNSRTRISIKMADHSEYSDGDYSSRYSDDFVSDDDIVSIKQPTKSQFPKKTSPYTLRSRGRGRGRGRGRTSQSMKQDVHRSGNSSVAMRMMSASRIKQNEFRNQLEEQKAQIQQLLTENKTLKKMQFRHEKALGKFEEKESELPQLLTKHSNEVRALREQNRRMKEKYEKTDRYLRDAEDDLDAYKVRLKKYKKLCESKGLPERDELSRKLHQAEIDLEEKDSKIKELERHIEKLNKNHRHELGIEMAHHRETKKHLREMEDKQNHVKEMLREKEKELEIKNIYSNRIMKAPHKLPASYSGTPHHTPPPARKKRNPSLTDLSSRDKVKLYEAKRREEEKQKLESPRRFKKSKEIWKQEERLSASYNRDQDTQFISIDKEREEQQADSWLTREREKLEHERKENERLDKEERKRLEEERKRLDEEMQVERERMKRESEEIKKLEKEREERLREDEERKHKTEKEREAREKEKRERERREREEWEREETKRRQDEAERIRIEQERLAEEERERMKNDPVQIAERKRKEILLAKMNVIDKEKKKEREDSSLEESFSNKQQATFIGSSKENQNGIQSYSRSPGLESNASTKSAYSFSKPVENMHHGLPSHEDITLPYLERQKKLKSEKEDIELGGYQPSFSRKMSTPTNKSPTNKNTIIFNEDFRRSSKPSNSDKKAKLMSDLFGKKTEDISSTDDLFSSPKKPPKKSGFPWDDQPKSNGTSIPPKRETSALFAGGTALVDEDNNALSDKSKLLPRRIRQPVTTTFSSKPAVSAIDNLDDDIEEVML